MLFCVGRTLLSDPHGLLELRPYRIIHDDGPAVGEGLDRMSNVGRHDRDQAGAGNLGRAIDGHFEFSLNHLIDFFLGECS